MSWLAGVVVPADAKVPFASVKDTRSFFSLKLLGEADKIRRL